MKAILPHLTHLIRNGNFIIIDEKNYHEFLNVSYEFNWDELNDFELNHCFIANGVLHNSCNAYYGIEYSEAYERFLPEVIKSLQEDLNSRRAVMRFDSGSCLLSLQWLWRDARLETIMTLRSWELQKYAPFDLCLAKQITQKINEHLNLKLGGIVVNVASAHVQI